MKKQKKNMGSLIKKAGVKGMAAGAVSLVLVAGGFHVLWEDYQRGNLFKPELFVKNRELQGNQIMFPLLLLQILLKMHSALQAM